ncbi:hypothetical protein C8J56DRAFT_1057878 [Mycena floridula]|nr:hypothetical protein C8J56DRAFT_1057878 [Mycena floridula]
MVYLLILARSLVSGDIRARANVEGTIEEHIDAACGGNLDSLPEHHSTFWAERIIRVTKPASNIDFGSDVEAAGPFDNVKSAETPETKIAPRTVEDETPVTAEPLPVESEARPGPKSGKSLKRSQQDVEITVAEDVKPKKKPKTVALRKSLNATQREEALEEDDWVKGFNAQSVRCKGSSCPQITNVLVTRKRKTIDGDNVPKRGTLATFFNKRKDAEGSALTSQQSATALESDSEDERPHKCSNIQYEKREVKPTKSIALIFDPAVPTETKAYIAPNKTSCLHLTGSKYNAYIDRTTTRKLGGVSIELVARVGRKILPWKNFSELKNTNTDARVTNLTAPVDTSVPPNGNLRIPIDEWTKFERGEVDKVLLNLARWEVDFEKRMIKSSACEGTTSNRDSVCYACTALTRDEVFKKAVQRKVKVKSLTQEEQRRILEARARYSRPIVQGFDSRRFLSMLEDPMLFDLHYQLENGDTLSCFLRLAKHAQEGHIKNDETLVEICKIFKDRLHKEIQYHRAFQSFWIGEIREMV